MASKVLELSRAMAPFPKLVAYASMHYQFSGGELDEIDSVDYTIQMTGVDPAHPVVEFHSYEQAIGFLRILAPANQAEPSEQDRAAVRERLGLDGL